MINPVIKFLNESAILNERDVLGKIMHDPKYAESRGFVADGNDRYPKALENGEPLQNGVVVSKRTGHKGDKKEFGTEITYIDKDGKTIKGSASHLEGSKPESVDEVELPSSAKDNPKFDKQGYVDAIARKNFTRAINGQKPLNVASKGRADNLEIDKLETRFSDALDRTFKTGKHSSTPSYLDSEQPSELSKKIDEYKAKKAEGGNKKKDEE